MGPDEPCVFLDRKHAFFDVAPHAVLEGVIGVIARGVDLRQRLEAKRQGASEVRSDERTRGERLDPQWRHPLPTLPRCGLRAAHRVLQRFGAIACALPDDTPCAVALL